ncbi:DUF4865 family protein [Cellulomonas fengjieae]|nr:DUF4865 family protein [Cellulomonas fengjieae]
MASDEVPRRRAPMYAMQYFVGLPSDYAMSTIRDRVRRTSHLMDGFAGLELKAYAVREKARGASRNEYAPFYVWRDVDGMRSFCWGETGYSAIVRDFGRQPIQDWTVAGVTQGPHGYADTTSLLLRTVDLPEGIAPSQCLEAVTEPFLGGTDPDTVARVAAVDVGTWRVLLAELSTRPADEGAPDHTGYEVLHVAAGP